MNAVLIDTPLWRAYFRNGAGQQAGTVAEILEQGRAATCGVVVAELAADAANAAAAATLAEALRGLPHLAMTDDVFRCAGELAVGLRAAGAALPLPRLLVAAAASVHRVPLLAADARLHALTRLVPLELLCL